MKNNSSLINMNVVFEIIYSADSITDSVSHNALSDIRKFKTNFMCNQKDPNLGKQLETPFYYVVG